MRNNQYDFEDKLQLIKILPSDFTSVSLVDSTFGKFYKESIVANQNQLTDNTDLIPNKQVLECPPFDLPELTSNFARVLSKNELYIFDKFSVSKQLSIEYERLTRDRSSSQD